MDGEHSLGRCDQVTRQALGALFEQLDRYEVLLDATVLKPNMVLPGSGHQRVPSDETIADATLAACTPPHPRRSQASCSSRAGKRPRRRRRGWARSTRAAATGGR